MQLLTNINKYLILMIVSFSLSNISIADDFADFDDAEFSDFDESTVGDEYDTSKGDIPDPLEGMNRAVFQFNEIVDKYALEPVAEIYGEYVPDSVKSKIDNVLVTLAAPSQFINYTLQGDVDNAVRTFWRTAINLTFGVGGMFDTASEFGIPAVPPTNFSDTLAKYGVGEGVYHVVPLLGPSTTRDLVGTVVDSFLNPIGYVDSEYLLIYNATNITHQREKLLQPVKDLRENSFDVYASMKSAYMQNKRRRIGQGRIHVGNTLDSLDLDLLGN